MMPSTSPTKTQPWSCSQKVFRRTAVRTNYTCAEPKHEVCYLTRVLQGGQDKGGKTRTESKSAAAKEGRSRGVEFGEVSRPQVLYWPSKWPQNPFKVNSGRFQNDIITTTRQAKVTQPSPRAAPRNKATALALISVGYRSLRTSQKHSLIPT